MRNLLYLACLAFVLALTAQPAMAINSPKVDKAELKKQQKMDRKAIKAYEKAERKEARTQKRKARWEKRFERLAEKLERKGIDMTQTIWENKLFFWGIIVAAIGIALLIVGSVTVWPIYVIGALGLAAGVVLVVIGIVQYNT